MSEESEYDTGEDILVDEEEEPCDYGIDTECVEPRLRNIGCCFECWLFQEMDEAIQKEAKKRDIKV